MGDGNGYIDDMSKAMLKKKTLAYLPRNLDNTDTQRTILLMIAQIVPSVNSCVTQADRMLWPQVAEGKMPVGEAVARCAFQVDKIIESTFLEGLLLDTLPQETLMQAWIALDYYCYVLKAGYSFNLRNLQDHISQILLDIREQPEPPTAAETARASMEDYGPTAPVGTVEDYGPTEPAGTMEDYGPTEPAGTIEDYGPTEPVKAADAFGPSIPVTTVEEQVSRIPVTTVESSIAQDKSRTTRTNQSSGTGRGKKTFLWIALLGAVVAVALFVLLVVIPNGKIGDVEAAIQNIGTVTMESGDRIAEAEQLFDALKDNQKKKVENRSDLTAARAELERLERLVREASEAIDDIGTVELNAGCKNRINEARKAYDALAPDDLQGYVSDKVSTLTRAEETYTRLHRNNESKLLYNTGMQRYESGQYETALGYFEDVVTDYPDTDSLAGAEQGMADCQIILAEKACNDKNLYEAMTLLNAVQDKFRSQESYTKTHEKVVKALDRAKPQNGGVVAGKIDWGRCYFDVKASDQDVCFKVENVNDPSKFKMVYIRAGKSATIKVEDGTYRVKWATGNYWFDQEHLFGDDTECMLRNGESVFTTTRSGNRIYYWYSELDIGSAQAMATKITPEQF